MESDERKLRKYFIKQIDLGRILTNKELEKYVKKRKLNVSSSFARKLRDKVLPTLLYKQPSKVKTYQTIVIERLGLLSMDFAFYKKDWKWHNSNCIGFLMVNSVVADKRVAIPMKSRKMAEFEKSIEQVCKSGVFPEVRTVLSDRETSLTSERFQKKMLDKYGIEFHFMHRNNKGRVLQ